MDTDASTDHDLGSALQGVAALFDYIRGVSFFAKDSSGRFIAAPRFTVGCARRGQAHLIQAFRTGPVLLPPGPLA
ncbi:MAG: hypothetical protein ACO3G9_11040, partial [Chthoniobacterales bacterium]